MKKIVRKSVTWLLIFGMVFTPLVTSIDLVAANAEEGSTVINIPEKHLTDANKEKAENATDAYNAGNDAAAAAEKAKGAAESASKAADDAAENLGVIEGLLNSNTDADNKLIKDANKAVEDANGLVDAANGAIGAANEAIGDANTALGDVNIAEGTMTSKKNAASTAIKNANDAIDAAKESKNTVDRESGVVEIAKEKMNDAIEATKDAKDVDAAVKKAIEDMEAADQSVKEAVEAIGDADTAVGVAGEALNKAIEDKTSALEKYNSAKGDKDDLEGDVKDAKDTAEAAVIAVNMAVDEALKDENTFGDTPEKASEAAVKAAEQANDITQGLETLATQSAEKAKDIADTASARLEEGAGRDELVGYVEQANAEAKKAAEYAKAAQESADKAAKAADKAEEIYNYLQKLYDEQKGKIDAAEKAYNDAIDGANTKRKVVNEDINGANTAIVTADESIGEANIYIDKAQTAITDADTAVSKANTDISTADTSVKAADEAIIGQNELIKTANGAIDDYNTAVGELDSAITTSNDLVDYASEKISDAEEAIIAENEAIKDYNAAVEEYNGAIEKANKAIEALDYTKADKAIEEAKAALAAAEKVLEDANAAKENAEALVKETETLAENAADAAKAASDKKTITDVIANSMDKVKNDLSENEFGKDYDTFKSEAEKAATALENAHKDYDQAILDNQAKLDGKDGEKGLTAKEKELRERMAENDALIEDADAKTDLIGWTATKRERAEKYVNAGPGNWVGLHKVSKKEYDNAVKYLEDLAKAEAQKKLDDAEYPGVKAAFDKATQAIADGNKAISDAQKLNDEKSGALEKADNYLGSFKLTSDTAAVITEDEADLLKAFASLQEAEDDTSLFEDKYKGLSAISKWVKESNIEKKYGVEWYKWLFDSVVVSEMTDIINDRCVVVCDDMEKIAMLKTLLAQVEQEKAAQDAEAAKANAAKSAEDAIKALNDYNKAREALDKLLYSEKDIKSVNKDKAPTEDDEFDLEKDSKKTEDLDGTEFTPVTKTDVEAPNTVDDKLAYYDETDLNKEKATYKVPKDTASEDTFKAPELGIDLEDNEIIKALETIGLSIDEIDEFKKEVTFPTLEYLLEKVNAAKANMINAQEFAAAAKEAAEKAEKAAKKAKNAADRAKHALDTYDEYTSKKDDGPITGGDIIGDEPFEMPTAGAASAVAGVRRNLVADAGDAAGEEVVADTTGTKVEEPKVIEEEEVPAAKEPAAKKTTTIDDEELPEAKAPEKAGFPWWILIVLAAGALAYGGYKYYDKKKNEDKVA